MRDDWCFLTDKGIHGLHDLLDVGRVCNHILCDVVDRRCFRFQSKGLSVRVLKGCVRTHQFLIYVYREARLRAIFADEAVRVFLAREGYQLPQEQSLNFASGVLLVILFVFGYS